MASWTVGKKISLGFLVLCLGIVIIGGIAVWGMKMATSNSLKVSQEYVPELNVINELSQNCLRMMSEFRGYGLTGEKEFLENGKKHLEALKVAISEARQLADKHSSLRKLRENIGAIENLAKEYESLLLQTVQLNEAVNQNRKNMNEAEKTFLEKIAIFLNDQYKTFEKEVSENIGADKLQERMNKVIWMNEVIDLGNAIIIANFRAQALRNPEIAQEAMKNFDIIEKKLEDIRKVTHRDINIQQIQKIKESASAYENNMNELIKNWMTLQEVNKKRGSTGDRITEMASSLSKAASEGTQNLTIKAASELSRSSAIVLAGSILILAIGLISAFFVTRGINRALKKSAEDLQESANQVSSAAAQLSLTSQSIAEGASQQAAGIEESSSAIEEMASMTRQNADNAEQANKLAKQAAQRAQDAKLAMEKLLHQMDDIVRSSEETQKIVKTIDEIAFQTNLLALNAAVEAARAGEAGAGFAVVADEVRALAMRAAEAAKNTATLIEETVKRVREGSAVTQETNNAFGEVHSGVMKVVELIDEIAAASREQSEGIGQINTAISEMDKVVQQNAANAEESAAAAEELSTQAARLKECVDVLIALVGKIDRKKTDYAIGKETTAKAKFLKSISSIESRTSTSKVPATRISKGKKVAGSKEVGPDEIIPFDDKNDFKDF